MGSVEHDERARDEDGVNVEPFLERALNDVVEELMAGEKVAGLTWTLMDFYGWQRDLNELVFALRQSPHPHDWFKFDSMIEKRLRAELEGSDVVTDRAAQMASEPDEQSS